MLRFGNKQPINTQGTGNIVNSPNSKVEITIMETPGKEIVIAPPLPKPLTLDPQDERFGIRTLLYSSRFVDLIGRDDVMSAIRSFVDTGYFDSQSAPKNRSVSVGVLSGEGGSGKSRIAYELCTEYSTEKKGWNVGFLDDQSLDQITDVLKKGKTFRWDKPTLLVVDYAAIRSEKIALWLRALASLENLPHPFRLLLLEREGAPESQWVKALLSDTSFNDKEKIYDIFYYEGSYAASSFLKLPPLKNEDCTKIFLKMLEKLDVSYTDKDLPDEKKLIEKTANGKPLYLIMTALTVKDIGFPKALALNRSSLIERFADKEYKRLSSMAPNATESKKLMGHLVACLTLMQGMVGDDRDKLRNNLIQFINAEKQATGYTENVGNSPDIADFLLEYFPTTKQNEVGYIIPDVIGEFFILKYLQSGQETFLRCCAFQDSQYEKNCLANAVRCVQDFNDTSKPLQWLTAYLENTRDDLNRLIIFTTVMPEQTVALRYLTLKNQERLTTHYRKLTEHNRDAFLPDLAGSLNNLANRLSKVRRNEALAVAQEAVKYRRELTEHNRDAFLPYLATSLNNLANRLSKVGRRNEALAAAQEAVKYRRELTEHNRDAFLPYLATSLNNLANRLSEVERTEEALAVAQEAVKYRRELTEHNRDTFLPDLAASLNNLANRLSEVERTEEALAVAQEAVKYRRELTEHNRDTFLPDLAASLNNLANRLSKVGRIDEALVIEQEAAGYNKELTERNRKRG